MPKWFDRLINRQNPAKQRTSFLRSVLSGNLLRVSDTHQSVISDIKTQIDVMRALATDSQINTALSYYATDATTVNTAGQIIWATPINDTNTESADIINALFKRWNINAYARDHILELATMGNLYIPTTDMYKIENRQYGQIGVVLDNNGITDTAYDIIPSYKIPPENIIHLWYRGKPQGYIMDPDDDVTSKLIMSEMACIHFSLGGLLGEYTIDAQNSDGDVLTYDIQFAEPLMAKAVQPTQTLSLLEDAIVLSSLSRVIKFINVECGTEDEEIRSALTMVKNAVEQQLSLDTNTGDVQSFVNPQSPNNLIYVPKINGQDAISITDLQMADSTEADNKLLQYYQDKKLSVLGVPKEAMNFSSNEGLGGAGSVLSQRSALYANSLQRLETAYIAGWTDALNKYFTARNLTGFINTFELHMNPIITTQSTVQFDKRDAALNQATMASDLLRNMGVTQREPYHTAMSEILSEVFPQMGAESKSWPIDVNMEEGGGVNAF